MCARQGLTTKRTKKHTWKPPRAARRHKVPPSFGVNVRWFRQNGGVTQCFLLDRTCSCKKPGYPSYLSMYLGRGTVPLCMDSFWWLFFWCDGGFGQSKVKFEVWHLHASHLDCLHSSIRYPFNDEEHSAKCGGDCIQLLIIIQT